MTTAVKPDAVKPNNATPKKRKPNSIASTQPMDSEIVRHIGVGIDTARYGHRVNFLREDKQLAAKAITVTENREGYDLLRTEIEALHGRHSEAMFHVHIDAAGQYAANLETFLRSLTMPMIVLHRDFREPSKIRLGPSIGFTICSAASFPNSP